ncbi:hypothetical protein, partial [Thiolapillus sp.]
GADMPLSGDLGIFSDLGVFQQPVRMQIFTKALEPASQVDARSSDLITRFRCCPETPPLISRSLLFPPIGLLPWKKASGGSFPRQLMGSSIATPSIVPTNRPGNSAALTELAMTVSRVIRYIINYNLVNHRLWR